MSDYDHLIYEVDADHICWLTLNRPEKLNAMNLKLIGELQAGLERADADEEVNVIVIQGAGRGFCAGHDLDEDAEEDRSSIYEYRAHYFKQFDEFTTPWRITKPVTASVNSIAIGKGFELTLFCDITIASDDTRIGYNEVRYGISGHCMFLPWLVNMKTAKDLLLTGREMSAREAKEMGLITEVVPLAELKEATRQESVADGTHASRDAADAQDVSQPGLRDPGTANRHGLLPRAGCHHGCAAGAGVRGVLEIDNREGLEGHACGSKCPIRGTGQ